MKPDTVIQLWLEIVKPCLAPEIVTAAPAAGWKVMGEPDTPECQGNTSSV